MNTLWCNVLVAISVPRSIDKKLASLRLEVCSSIANSISGLLF